jgi:hypothetical protein
MATCNFCGTTILFGGPRDGEIRYCNARCQQSGRLLTVSNQIPQEQLQEHLWKTHQGTCPKCGAAARSTFIKVTVCGRPWS